MPAMRRPWVAALILMCACDLMQMKRDRDTVKALTPAPLAPAAASGPAPAAARIVRVRAAVDDAYAAQNREYAQRVRDLFARATEFARPRFGVTFELVSIDRWEHPPINSLKPLVDQLKSARPADGAHLVVGFTSALPLFSSTFEDVGAAHLFGRHAVLRGIDASAYADYLQARLKTVGDDEKDGVVRSRVQHQETAVFLHEWGHALGALHDRDLEHLMCPQYRDSLRDFSTASARLIELGLSHLDDADVRPWLEEARKAQLELPLTAFAPNERESLWETADGGSAAPAPPAPSTFLSETDRKLFQIAIEKQDAGRYGDALTTALPIAARNPAHPTLATFVCAMSVNTKAAETIQRCTVAAALSGDDARAPLWLGWAHADAKNAAAARQAADEAAARLDRGAPNVELEANLAQLYRRLGCAKCAEGRTRASDLPLASDAPTAEAADASDKFSEGVRATIEELRAKRTAKAIERAYSLTRDFPKQPAAWALACEAQLPVSPANARAACNKAAQLDPSSGRAHYLLAVLDEAAGRRGDAVAHLEKAVAGEPSNTDAWQRLGRLYRGLHMTAAVDALSAKYQKRFGKPLP